MTVYKQYMRSIEEEIRAHYIMGDEEWIGDLIESVMESFGVNPEQVIRQIMVITGHYN